MEMPKLDPRAVNVKRHPKNEGSADMSDEDWDRAIADYRKRKNYEHSIPGRIDQLLPSTNDDFMAMLESVGIDPLKFQSDFQATLRKKRRTSVSEMLGIQ